MGAGVRKRSRINHGRSEPADRVLHKVTWLRGRIRERGGPDPDTVETLDVLAEAIVRLDARLRAIQGNFDRRLSAIEPTKEDDHAT